MILHSIFSTLMNIPIIGSAGQRLEDYSVRMLQKGFKHRAMFKYHSNPKIPGIYGFRIHLPDEDFFHSGDRGPKAGNAQLFLPQFQVSKQSFKPGREEQVYSSNNPYYLNPSLLPLAFYKGKRMGYGVKKIFVQISILSLLSFITELAR